MPEIEAFTMKGTSRGGIQYTVSLSQKPADRMAVLKAFDSFLSAVAEVRGADDTEAK